MDDIYSDSSISRLCISINDAIDSSSDKLEQYVDILQLCACPKSTISRSLTNLELISSTLRVHSFREIMALNFEHYLDILNILLEIADSKSWNILSTIVLKLLKSDLNENDKKRIIDKVWFHKDSACVPFKLIIAILDKNPELLEMHLTHLYLDSTKVDEDPKNIWKEPSSSCWIRWSCQSSEMFNIVSSIMNELLFYVKSKQHLIYIIGCFIDSIIDECQQMHVDFVSLYPYDCQGFVSLLLIEPFMNPCRSFIAGKLKSMRIEKPSEALLFLTHFQKWAPLMNVN